MKTETRPYRLGVRAAGVEDTRQRILDATIAEFWAAPSPDVRLDAVAQRAGVTVQTVLRHFGSKQDLLAQAGAWQSQHIASTRDPAAVTDAASAVAQLVTHYEEVGDGVLRLLAEEHRTPGLADIIGSGRELHRQWCRTVFAATLAALPPADRRRRLAQLVAICDVYTWKLLATGLRTRPCCHRDGPRRDAATPPHRTVTTEGAQMTRILAYTSPARGHLFPLTPILRELQARGHDIFVRTLAAEVAHMRSLGFAAEAIDPRIEAIELADWQQSGGKASLTSAVTTFSSRARFDAPDLQGAIEQISPDAVIVDTNSWGAQAAATAWGGPWASFCPFPVPLTSVDAPPFGMGLRPARGPLGRLRDKAMTPPAHRDGREGHAPAVQPGTGAVRTERPASADDLYLAPPLTLYLTAEPFEYHRRDWPESFALIGPCEWDPDVAAPEWLDGVDRPIVLVTTSSEYQADEKLARTALEALADEPVFVVVTGPVREPRVVHGARERSGRAVPAARTDPRPGGRRGATYCGMGATQKALARGVPVCAVPFGRDGSTWRAGSRSPGPRCGCRRSG